MFALLHLLCDFCLDDVAVVDGTVVLVGGQFLYLFHCFHSAYYASKYGVAAVEMWGTSDGFVGFAHLGGEFEGVVGPFVDALLGAVERCIVKGLSGDDGELCG